MTLAYRAVHTREKQLQFTPAQGSGKASPDLSRAREGPSARTQERECMPMSNEEEARQRWRVHCTAEIYQTGTGILCYHSPCPLARHAPPLPPCQENLETPPWLPMTSLLLPSQSGDKLPNPPPHSATWGEAPTQLTWHRALQIFGL